MAETAAELGWTAKGPALTSFRYDGGLALFPLPLVLFPGAILPLQIFEFRYRIMMHTLLETDLRFGVVFYDVGSVAGVGCVGEVVKHERLVDDRFFLICKGQERFRITRLTRTKPYLVADVAWLEDRPPPPGTRGGGGGPGGAGERGGAVHEGRDQDLEPVEREGGNEVDGDYQDGRRRQRVDGDVQLPHPPETLQAAPSSSQASPSAKAIATEWEHQIRPLSALMCD